MSSPRPCGSVATPTITYAYGPTTHLPISIADSLYGTQTFQYDALERLRAIGGAGIPATYTLDDAGRRTRIAFNWGDGFDYEYDENDNLTRAKSISRTDDEKFTYDSLNRLINQKHLDGGWTTYAYDPRGFLSNQQEYGWSGANLYNRGYLYDNVGNVKQEFVGGVPIHTYQYDDLDRIIQADMTGDAGAVRQNYSYDVGGNRLSQSDTKNGQTITRYFYYNDGNRFTSDAYSDGRPSNTLDYDVSGNCIRAGTTNLTWNARGELVSIPIQNTTFAYDMFGRRVSQTIGNDVFSYGWEGWNLMSDHRSNTATNPPIDSGFFIIEASSIMDGTLIRGDTIAITDRRGDVVAVRSYGQNVTYGQFEYSPFGQQIKSTGNVSLTDYPYRFAGQENEGNDLYNMRNRYYAPDWGRFFSEDPIGLLGGTNLYAYSFNNPVTFSDPSGLLAIGWDSDHPWIDFTLQGTSVGLQTGMAASATAFSFGMYDGGSFKCQPGFGTSVVLATISREAALQAATMGAGNALKGVGPLSAASKACFTGDTLILMAYGSSKPISEIQYDDLVLTKSDATGLVEAKSVTRVFSHQELSTLKVTFGDGSVLRTTPEHPFWVSGQGWIPAGRLAVGNAIVTRAGPQGKEKSTALASVKTVRGREKVYNFTVEDAHTYFVADANGTGDAKWVHNGCTQAFEVGSYNALKAGARNTGLEIHHIPQAHVAEQLIPGYLRNEGLSIALPRMAHRGLPATSRLFGDFAGMTAGEARVIFSQQLRDLANAGVPKDALRQIGKAMTSRYPWIYE